MGFVNFAPSTNDFTIKRILLLSIMVMASLFAFSQTQQGYVKTKGRMDAKGNLIPGKGLKGTAVSVQGRTSVIVNKDDGAFSLLVSHPETAAGYSNIGLICSK